MADYADVYYQSSDGLRLYARDYPCRDSGRAGAPVILCLHGLTRNSADFAGLAEYLSARYRVIAVDNRGRGLSEYDSNVANYTPATYVQDMFTLLAELGVDQVVLCGTSMGGLMSFMMAAMEPQRVQGIIINDIGPEIDPAGLDRIKGYVGKSGPVSNWDEAIAQAREINQVAFPDFSEQEWEDFTRGIYREQNGVPVLAYDPAISQPMSDDESNAVPPDLWPLFDASSAIPMLVIRGESSDILAPHCVATMRSKKPDLAFAEIPHRGHAPTLNEALSRQAIDQFLAGL
ncbi:alpha/beta fold hydrolase [Seongchinamella sediminis]|uniref:Alpha/beta fold hydrolase n=1 Tax=Seongchinamella sediminis TaxID=2283635 RepID=A0A3L7E0R6_9GAMM|nr:alpha/beta hydrolase [Seongchinamella sediminis]RLQ23437.1 alpha/beta fold hydrolase [Seongchinamella sediminis]